MLCGNIIDIPDIVSDVLQDIVEDVLKTIPDDEPQSTEAKQPSTPPIIINSTQKQGPYIAPKSRGFSFLSDKLKPYFNFEKMYSYNVFQSLYRGLLVLGILGYLMATIGCIGDIIWGDPEGMGSFYLIVFPIGYIVYFLFLRLLFERLILIFQISKNLTEINDKVCILIKRKNNL